jgi:hypothetical protein
MATINVEYTMIHFLDFSESICKSQHTLISRSHHSASTALRVTPSRSSVPHGEPSLSALLVVRHHDPSQSTSSSASYNQHHSASAALRPSRVLHLMACHVCLHHSLYLAIIPTDLVPCSTGVGSFCMGARVHVRALLLPSDPG